MKKFAYLAAVFFATTAMPQVSLAENSLQQVLTLVGVSQTACAKVTKEYRESNEPRISGYASCSTPASADNYNSDLYSDAKYYYNKATLRHSRILCLQTWQAGETLREMRPYQYLRDICRTIADGSKRTELLCLVESVRENFKGDTSLAAAVETIAGSGKSDKDRANEIIKLLNDRLSAL